MSKEALAKVVQRAISDAAFRRQLSTDPSGALRGFDVTADEAAAIRSADAGKLSALGIDQRMSKAFTLGGSAGSPSMVGGTDIGTFGSAITTGNAGTAGGDVVQDALVTGGNNDSDALIGGSSTFGSAVVGGDGSQLGNTLTSGDDALGSAIPTDPTLGGDALTGNDPAHAFGAVSGGDPNLGNTLTAGDDSLGNALTTDGGAAGSTLPGEAAGGTEFSQ